MTMNIEPASPFGGYDKEGKYVPYDDVVEQDIVEPEIVNNVVTNTDVVILTTDQQKQIESHYTLSDLQNLDNDSVNRVIAQGILRFVPYEQIGNVLATIYDKLSTNGEIIIEDVDIRQIAYQIVKKHLLNPNTSQILANTKSSMSLSEMVEVLQKVGFVVVDKKIVKSSYYIKAKNHA